MDEQSVEKPKSPTIEGAPKPPHPEVPQFTKENIAQTATQMYPGCKVLWGKGVAKKYKITVLLYGSGEPEGLVPFSMEAGSLVEIAKTLVTMFACCQHVVMQRIQGEVMKNERIKQMDAQVRIHTNSPVIGDGEEVAPLTLPPEESDG